MLLVLLLGVADFGRVFAAGITIEAASRDAAEIVAEQYRRFPPDGQYADQTQPAPSPGDPAFYQPLHDLAARTVCREMRGLDNTTYVPDDPATPAVDEESCFDASDPDASAAMPSVLVCIHDGADPLCASPSFGSTIPPNCSALASVPVNSMDGGAEHSRYVEVRACYRFTTLFNLSNANLGSGWGLSIGDIWLQKSRIFTVAYFPPPPTPSPPPAPSAPSNEELPSDTPSPSPTGSAVDTPTPSPSPTPACLVPVANFSAVPASGTSPLIVQFTDSSVPRNCPVLTYDWNFGDGTSHSTAPSPQHTFVFGGPPKSKTFTVTLTVTSAAGTDTRSGTITVSKP
jgi:hypothetical protein